MKFLVLALCVAAASAATFSSFKPYNPAVAPVVAAQAAAYVATPVAKVAKTVYGGVEAEAPVVRSDSEVTAEGFRYNYETANGISAEAAGSVKRVGDVNALTSQGGYRYTAPDGTPVVVNYIADENGFQPQSDILPVGPAIPDAILRSLEFIAANYKPEVEKKY